MGGAHPRSEEPSCARGSLTPTDCTATHPTEGAWFLGPPNASAPRRACPERASGFRMWDVVDNIGRIPLPAQLLWAHPRGELPSDTLRVKPTPMGAIKPIFGGIIASAESAGYSCVGWWRPMDPTQIHLRAPRSHSSTRRIALDCAIGVRSLTVRSARGGGASVGHFPQV
jgi:hypothetical protein